VSFQWRSNPEKKCKFGNFQSNLRIVTVAVTTLIWGFASWVGLGVKKDTHRRTCFLAKNNGNSVSRKAERMFLIHGAQRGCAPRPPYK